MEQRLDCLATEAVLGLICLGEVLADLKLFTLTADGK